MSVCSAFVGRDRFYCVHRRVILFIAIFVGFGVELPTTFIATAQAADAMLPQSAGALPSKTPPAQAPTSFDWAGLYVGGYVGYSRGSAAVVLTDPNPTSFSSPFGTLVGGMQVGYNLALPSRVLFGIEADMSFPNFLA